MPPLSKFIHLTQIIDESFCVCGAGWTKHCKHPECRWYTCTNAKHTAIIDVKAKRLWGTVVASVA